MGIYLHDIIIKTHVKHSVRLIENKERDFGKIHITHAEMSEKTSGSRDHYIRTHFKTFTLLFICKAIGSAIDSHTADRHKISEALQLTVNLLCEFAGRCHYHTINGIRRITAVSESVNNRKQICRRLTCTGLCAGK